MTDKEKAEVKKRHKHLAAIMLLLLGSAAAYGEMLISDMGTTTITVDQFAWLWYTKLISVHAHSAYIGRNMAGNYDPFGRYDEAVGSSAAATQVPFLIKFREDIRSGRYGKPGVTPENPGVQNEVPFSEEAVRTRLNLYVERVRGTANEVVSGLQTAETQIVWLLDPGVKDHCASCLTWAGNSPYTRDTMPAHPGDGKSECGPNCHCKLLIDDVDISF